MYFPPRTSPLDLSAGRLNGLRLSLNTPVVSIEELPVGPARAAIAIHQEADGTPNLTVGVRSLRSGAAVLFSLEEDLQGHSSLAVGIDAALSFGEGMGFLFDEDELDADSTEEARGRALDFWLELMGQDQDFGASGEVSLEPGPADSESDRGFEIVEAPDGEELLLEEEMADAEEAPPDLALAGASPPTASAEPETSGGTPVLLSKFRHCAPSQTPSPPVEEPRLAGGDASPAPKRTALGRLKLVKRRKARGEGPPKPSVIQRLLSAF